MQELDKKQNFDVARLYREFAPSIYRLCWKFVRDRQVALDLRQDIFLKVIKGASSFRGECLVSTWIYQIARYHCMDYLRSRNRNGWIIAESQVDYCCDGSSLGLEEKILLRNDLAPILKPLETETRLMLELHAVEGYSHSEIADVLGCSRGKVGRRMRNLSKKVYEHSPALREAIW